MRHLCAKLVAVEYNQHERTGPMQITTIGIDIAKRVF